MAKNQNTWAKRKREMDKKRKAEEKRELRKARREEKKEGGSVVDNFEGATLDEFGNVIEPERPEVEELPVEESEGESEGENTPPATE